MPQLDLFADVPAIVPATAEPEPAGLLTIEERFRRFEAANPWVMDALVRMARELVAKGHRRIGISMLFESLRWLHMRRTSDPTSGFRLNNVLRSRYARAIMERHPDLAGVFETRELQTD